MLHTIKHHYKKTRSNLLNLIRPTIICESLLDIDFYSLKEDGIQNILCDVDNTIISYKNQNVSIQYLNLFNEIKSHGFNIILLSNNSSQQRIEIVAKQLELTGIAFSCKPFPFTAKKVMNQTNMKNTNTVIIGDQLFTDILLGSWLNAPTIFVDPISTENCSFIKRTQYNIEQHLLKTFID